MLLNKQQITEKIKRNQNMHRNKWKYKDPKPMRFSKSCAKEKVRSNTCLPQETKEKSNKLPNFTPTATRKRRNEEP